MSAEQEKQEGQKTVVSFIAGLLVGGLLVWVFSSSEPTAEAPAETSDAPAGEVTGNTDAPAAESGDAAPVSEAAPTLPVGKGSIAVAGQAAGNAVALGALEFPSTDGWVAVRDYDGTNVGGILGASRYSASQGLLPTSVDLLRPTVAGKTYAVVFFTEDGSLTAAGKLFFDPAQDQQFADIMTTFVAQ
jgi:hypothetical protein